jgi:hypothetical protein
VMALLPAASSGAGRKLSQAAATSIGN